MWNSLMTGTSALHVGSDTRQTETDTHAKCVEESIFQLSTDADQNWLMASNESHAGSHEPHQMMSGHSHSRLVRIKCKVLSSPPKQTASHDSPSSRQQQDSITAPVLKIARFKLIITSYKLKKYSHAWSRHLYLPPGLLQLASVWSDR